MAEKMSDLTLVDIKAVIAQEERNFALHTVEQKFTEAKLRLLHEELERRRQSVEGGKVNIPELESEMRYWGRAVESFKVMGEIEAKDAAVQIVAWIEGMITVLRLKEQSNGKQE